MADVQAATLQARLVVLSCSNSGVGNITGEGVVGIARAFLGSGARSVLVALWEIYDEATMAFMEIFYKHLVDGKSASVALHQAVNYLRDSEKFCDVKYWAPFVLIGDDVTIEFRERKQEAETDKEAATDTGEACAATQADARANSEVKVEGEKDADVEDEDTRAEAGKGVEVEAAAEKEEIQAVADVEAGVDVEHCK